MNDIKSKEQELKNKFNNGLIQYEEYNYYMNELSKSISVIIAHTTFLFGMYIYHSTERISQHNI